MKHFVSKKRNDGVSTPEESLLNLVWKYLAEETVRIAIVVFWLASFMKVVPFQLENNSSLRVKMFPERSWRMLAWHCVNYLVFANFIFLYVSFGVTLRSQGFGQDVAIHMLYLIVSLFATVYFISLYQRPHECLKMLNQFEFLLENLKARGIGHKHWAWHPFSILAVYYLAYMLFAIWIVLTGLFVWRPTASIYLFGYLPQKMQGSSYIFGACLVYEMLYVMCWGLELMFFFCYWCADIFTLNLNLVELGETRKTTINSLKAYLDLQMFSILFNGFNGGFFNVGFIFVLVFTPTLCTVVTLKAFDLMSIFVYVIFPMGAFFTLVLLIGYFCPQHTLVQCHSEAVLKSMKSKLQLQSCDGGTLREIDGVGRHKVLLKRIEACRPMQIQIAFFGGYTLETVKGMIEQVFNNVLLLLSL